MNQDRWRVWVVIGTLGALAGALRVPFAFIPSVQPSTALVIVAGQAMGPLVGAGVGILVPLVSNVALGHGPWTPFQALAWGLVGLLSGILPPMRRIPLAAWGFVSSLVLFGLIMDGYVWLLVAHPRDLAQLLFVVARGLPFNLAHAFATAGVLVWAGPRLLRILDRGRVRILGRPARRRRFLRSGAPTEAPTGPPGFAPARDEARLG